MSTVKYIRVRRDGAIYPYSPILEQRPDCEVITEQEAFPERFIPTKQRGRKTKLILESAVEDKPEDKTDPALSADAGKGLPK